MQPRTTFPQSHRLQSARSRPVSIHGGKGRGNRPFLSPTLPHSNTPLCIMKNIFAVSGIVIKELYRRKDFYVLFILTVLICLVMASVNVFNDTNIVRYLKEICLLLLWVSSLVIAITTTARQIPV